MMFTTRMKHVMAIVLDHDSDKITKELLRLGLLHFIKMTALKSRWHDRVEDVIPEIAQARIMEVKKRIESFLGLINKAEMTYKIPVMDKFTPVRLDEIDGMLNQISDKIQGYRDRQEKLQQEILKMKDIQRQVDLFGDIREGIKARTNYSFLNIQTGSLPSSRVEDFSAALKQLPSVCLKFDEHDNRTTLLVITMKKDDIRVNSILEKYGWVDVEIEEEMYDTKEKVIHDLDIKLGALTKEQGDLEKKAKSIIEEKSKMLIDLLENLILNELYYRVKSYFSKTARTILFSGWIPAEKQKIFEEGIRNTVQGRCYIEFSNPVDVVKEKNADIVDGMNRVEVPVDLKTPHFLSPFQMLVKNYAIPEYGSIDPSPFVAVAYFCMFGLMFGDAGQGLVLILAGFLGSLYYKNRNNNLLNLSGLIIWCGFSAIIFGILFGSYFGFPLFRPLWIDYHGIVTGHSEMPGVVRDVFGILFIVICFGILVISVGLILNWINLIVKKRWFKLFIDKSGILGGWMYFGGVYIIWNFIMHEYKELPNAYILFFGFLLPTLLFLFKPPLEFIIHKKHDPSIKITPMKVAEFVMSWFVEIIEIVGGYLSNTLSFMRIAGLGLAHTSLMVAFIEIAKMTGPVGALPMLVLGNGLVIFLEGLSAGIQSLRLNYYEFFSKYFTGTGLAYSPISLHGK